MHNKINANKRLNLIADIIKPGSVVCDVGTDHGYLASKLILTNKCQKVIACDINQKPLDNAKNTIENLNISKDVELVLSDGLKSIKENSCETIVIAGMGGELILDILFAVSWTRNTNMTFILQPMSNIDVLRKNLYLNGFYIDNEYLVYENNHIYTILKVLYCGDIIEVDEYFSIIGKILKTNSKIDDNVTIYLNRMYNKLKNIQLGLKKSQKEENEPRILELEKLICRIQEEISD